MSQFQPTDNNPDMKSQLCSLGGLGASNFVKFNQISSPVKLLKGTHARDFIVRFSHFFGIIQQQTRLRPRISKILLS